MTAYYALMGWIIANTLIFVGAIELHQWSRRRSNARGEAALHSIWSRLFDPGRRVHGDRPRLTGFDREAEVRAKRLVAPLPRR